MSQKTYLVEFRAEKKIQANNKKEAEAKIKKIAGIDIKSISRVKLSVPASKIKVVIDRFYKKPEPKNNDIAMWHFSARDPNGQQTSYFTKGTKKRGIKYSQAVKEVKEEAAKKGYHEIKLFDSE